MLLNIRHRTRYEYDPAAAQVALKLKLFPARTDAQTVRNWTVSVNGAPPHTRLVNGYGDEEAIWIGRDGLSAVEVVATGVVETRDTIGVLGDWRMAARRAMFLRATPLTEADEDLRRLATEATAGKTGLDAAHALSAAVREAVDYRPGATTATTTATEALRAGAGVCQDHTHIFISAARTLGAPARYVVGYLFVGEGDDPALSAETETHAWAEMLIDGLGWVGFDPSNQVCPTDHYIRLAAGLDAPDAAPLRGAVVGAADETLKADVEVTQAQQ